jgi:hypothetical protein
MVEPAGIVAAACAGSAPTPMLGSFHGDFSSSSGIGVQRRVIKVRNQRWGYYADQSDHCYGSEKELHVWHRRTSSP